MAAVIRKKAKAKRQHDKKMLKMKKFPKRSKKLLVAPMAMPNRDQIEAEVHRGSEFINKELKPLLSSKPLRPQTYSERMNDLSRQIKEKRLQKSQEANESLNAIRNLNEYNGCIIEVLDARDPDACRFMELEDVINSQGSKAKLAFIINKIDLVPREAAMGWGAHLEKIAPVLALCAHNEITHDVLVDFINNRLGNPPRVSLVGLPGVGKSTLVNQLPSLTELPSFCFHSSTVSSVLLKASVWEEPAWQFAVEVLSRRYDGTIFDELAIPGDDDPIQVLTMVGENEKIHPKVAGARLADQMFADKFKWYAVPSDTQWAMSPAQTEAMNSSTPAELQIPISARLTPGIPIQVDNRLLEGQVFSTKLAEEEEDDNDAK